MDSTALEGFYTQIRDHIADGFQRLREDGGKHESVGWDILHATAHKISAAHRKLSSVTVETEGDLPIDSMQMVLVDGDEKYTLTLRPENGGLSFVLSHDTAVGVDGVIDADAVGIVIRSDSEGFEARYPNGWVPAPHLRKIVDRALASMWAVTGQRKGLGGR